MPKPLVTVLSNGMSVAFAVLPIGELAVGER